MIVDNKSETTKVVVACDICLKEIPISEAKVEEASDYVSYFCGLPCYEKWQKGNNEDNKI